MKRRTTSVRRVAAAAAATLSVLCFRWDAGAAEIEFVTVGDPGNSPTIVQYTNGIPILVGGVGYTFRIGKYELTRAQYVEFLNTVDPSGANLRGLWNEGDAAFIGIHRDVGAPPAQRYRLDTTANANLPVLVPSWYAAARFCNWLHNGKGGVESTEGTAQSGAYDTRFFDDGDVANDPPGRNPGAKFWIPSESEWIKAGHYKGGSINAGYWTGPNRSNTVPKAGFPPGGVNSANFSSSSVAVPRKPVPVGSYRYSFSPYGAYDMAGNEHEWTESWYEGDDYTPPNTVRMSRGGHYRWLPDHSRIWYRVGTHQTSPLDWRLTFRVATWSTPTGLELTAVPFVDSDTTDVEGDTTDVEGDTAGDGPDTADPPPGDTGDSQTGQSVSGQGCASGTTPSLLELWMLAAPMAGLLRRRRRGAAPRAMVLRE